MLTAFAILILKTVTSEEYESNKTKFKTEKETKKMDAKQNKKSGANNQSNDPFSQYTGWHNGKEEVRGHPSMVLDIHCSKLRFAISETQVDTMIKIYGKYSKRRRSNIAVIIVRIIFIGSFLFYCLLLNHSFPTNPNKITNCFKLFSLFQLYNYIAPASLFDF